MTPAKRAPTPTRKSPAQTKEEIQRLLEAKTQAEEGIVKIFNDFTADTGYDIQSIDFDWEHLRDFGSKKPKHVLRRVILHVGKDD